MADAYDQPTTNEVVQSRIYSACIPCQKRKKKCDGSRPVCHLCAKLGTGCLYTKRKGRGLAKNPGLIQSLEDRLERIEASTKAQPAREMPPTTATVPVRSEAGNVGLSTTKAQSGVDTRSHIELSSFRPLTEFTTELELSRQRLLNGIKLTPFPQPTFTSLLPNLQMAHLIQSTWDETLFHGSLFALEAIMTLLREQFEAGSDTIAGNPSRWAIINSVTASAIVQKTANDYLETMAFSAWAHFKNAFSTFPELLTRGTSILDCEALLSMALFMRSTADARTTSQLINAAVRLLHMIEFPCKGSNTNIEDSLYTRRERVTRVAYILDVEMLHKYGLPSAFGSVESISENWKSLQNSCLSDDFCQTMIGLATMQLHVDEPFTFSKRAPIDMKAAQNWESAHNLLQEWRRRHEHLLQAEELTEDSLLVLQRALVILTYHTTSVRTHMKRARFRHLLSSVMNPVDSQHENQTFEAIRSSWSSCISSSRDMIRAMHGLESQAFHCLWELMGYPLSAALLLLSAVLEDPESSTSQTNIAAITEFIQFVEDLQKHGSDVQGLVAFCNRFREVALWAIDRQKMSRGGFFSGGSSLRHVGVERCIESLREKLTTINDWMHLAQGLLSNIPVLQRQSAEIFSGVMGDEIISNNLCVPKVMRWHDLSFAFGS